MLILGTGQMKYSVYQPWDPLKVCVVGRSYNPEFYHFIKNPRVRTVMEQIAEETEEDYQKLITLLESFGVKVLRPSVTNNYRDYLITDSSISPPPMTPRDYTASIGNNFYIDSNPIIARWDILKGSGWPEKPINHSDIPLWVIDECKTMFNITNSIDKHIYYSNVIDEIRPHMSILLNQGINTAMTSRIGRDLYFGTENYNDNQNESLANYSILFPNHRCHIVNTGGHSDGVFCPVVPGLIVSLRDIPTYAETFPGWEVVYLPGQSWHKVSPFLKLKQKNKGKWWVPGEELNDDFTDFVEEWLGHWVGYVEETVFDVNMLVIDEKNVVCNNYNETVFKAFDRYGITPHVINFRHRYFWDGGLHCITSDIHREGVMKDYFPGRG
jgi:uncharacterized protein YerC